MKLLATIIFAILSFAAAPAPAPAPTTQEAVRFAAVDVRIDPAGKALAAYQVEFIADSSSVKLVGIEGGDHAAFAQPPYYDPAALSRHRVILAAFNTATNLPSSPFRAARLHVQISGTDKPKWEAKLLVSAAADGSALAATVNLVEGADQ